MYKSRRKLRQLKTLAKVVASFTVHFIPEQDGGYSVMVPALPGCYTQGDTFEEAERYAHDAIRLYLQSLVAHGEPIPHEGETVFKRISVAVNPRRV